MSTETNMNGNVRSGEGVTVETTGTSASFSLDNTITAEANAGISCDYASVSLEANAGASVKTGTIIETQAGLIDNNVVVNASYSDTTEVHITAEASVCSDELGVGVGISADAYAKTGTEASLNMSVGQNGVSAEAEASIGSCVGVDAEGTVGLREASVTGGAGVNIGDHFEIGGGGQATFDKGVATVGVSGDVAALIGVEADITLNIDTKQIQKDTIVVKDTTEKAVEIIIKEAPKIIDVSKEIAHETDKVTKEVEKITNDTVKKAGKEVNKIGKSIKKGLHL